MISLDQHYGDKEDIMSQKIGDLVVNIQMKADFSWFTALKLRIAGGQYIAEYIKKQCESLNDSMNRDEE